MSIASPNFRERRCRNVEAHGVTRRDLMTIVLAGGAVLFSGCDALGPSWKYRYRLTAQVEKAGQTYEGSSVIEIVRTKAPDGSINGKTRGEAVAVDVPGSGALFLLLSGSDGGADWAFTMPHHAFAARLGSRDMVNDALLTKLTQMKGETATLTPDLFPTLVRFRDIADPKSVEVVDPANLAASFGPGVSLQRITVAITENEVDSSIKKRLPNMGDSSGYLQWQQTLPNDDPRRTLTRQEFIRESAQ